MRVAVLQAELSHGELLSRWLHLAGHQPHTFALGALLLRALEQEPFDCLLLDWDVPDLPGIEVLKRVRNDVRSTVPVLFVTSRNSEGNVVLALRTGADGYMIKPVHRMELLARLEALARRARRGYSEADVIVVEEFSADCQTRMLLRYGKCVDLTAKDFDVSVLFLRNVGRLLSRRYILEAVWGSNTVTNSRTLDTHVSRIRRKLRLTSEHGWRLAAVYRHGYRLEQIDPDPTIRPRDQPSLSIAAA